MTYRDDTDALRARISALETELEEARAKKKPVTSAKGLLELNKFTLDRVDDLKQRVEIDRDELASRLRREQSDRAYTQNRLNELEQKNIERDRRLGLALIGFGIFIAAAAALHLVH